MQTVATSSEALIWARVIAPDRNGLSPEIARSILELRFSDEDKARMKELAEKNQEGLLSDAERQELEGYVKVGDVLSLLHLKARKSLKRRCPLSGGSGNEGTPGMDEATREEIVARSGGRCEYCHLPAEYVITPFQTEHIVAKQHGGKDTLANLAYACLRCNLHKGPNLAGIDPKTKRLTRLFNPRKHAWAKHFRWEGAMLAGKTAVGRTTVAVLAMNDPERVALRQELIEQGLLLPG